MPHIISIDICNNVAEAIERKGVIKAANPGANWVTRIVENIDAVLPYLVPDIASDPIALPPVFTPGPAKPSAPAVVLLAWTVD